MKTKLLKLSSSTNQNGTIETLSLVQVGRPAVISIRFYMNKPEQALRSKSIWINGIEQQLNIPEEERTPSYSQLRDYYLLVDDLTLEKAIEKASKEINLRLKKLIADKHEINIYTVINKVGNRTYTNYQPYNPNPSDETDDEGTEDFE